MTRAVRLAALTCALVSALSFMTGLAEMTLATQILLPVSLASLWAVALLARGRPDWLLNGIFFISVAAAGLGTLLLLPFLPMVIAVGSALAAWDLGAFSARLSGAEQVHAPGRLLLTHGSTLLISLMASGLLIWVERDFHPQMAFEWILALGLLSLIAFTRSLRALTRQNL